MTGRLSLDEALAALARGEVVALPTDTVYGLGASIAVPGATDGLFAFKRRPLTSALPVVAASLEALGGLVTAWPEGAARLAATMWPGALTLVVPSTPALCAAVRSASGRVGFRVPDEPALAELLAASGPLALTSANEHGEPPCVSAEEVLARFADREALAGVLDAGRRDRPVSTVVDFPGDGWRVVRHGAVTDEEMRAALA